MTATAEGSQQGLRLDCAPLKLDARAFSPASVLPYLLYQHGTGEMAVGVSLVFN